MARSKTQYYRRRIWHESWREMRNGGGDIAGMRRNVNNESEIMAA